MTSLRRCFVCVWDSPRPIFSASARASFPADRKLVHIRIDGTVERKYLIADNNTHVRCSTGRLEAYEAHRANSKTRSSSALTD